jgi:hypothetical protein
VSALDAACTAAVDVGLVCASIGALAIVSDGSMRMRLEGALCILVGTASIVAGNVDALRMVGIV